MSITELIEKLQKIKDSHGDIIVYRYDADWGETVGLGANIDSVSIFDNSRFSKNAETVVVLE